MELPLLPLDLMAVNLEAHAFRLNYMERLDVVAKLELLSFLLQVLLDELRQEIVFSQGRWQPLPI